MSSMRQNYNSLNLVTLATVDLTDSQWQILERGRLRPLDRKFRSSLPLVVAQFKESAAKDIMVWARRQKGTDAWSVNPFSAASDPPKPEVFTHYMEDLAALDKALYGDQTYIRYNMEVGKFTRLRQSKIHGDQNNCPYNYNSSQSRLYVTRLGNLPVQYVRQAEIDALPLIERWRSHILLRMAGYLDLRFHDLSMNSVDYAKNKLAHQGILKPLPLGAVALMSLNFRGRLGTPHCSATVPEVKGTIRPVPSAFLRAKVFQYRHQI